MTAPAQANQEYDVLVVIVSYKCAEHTVQAMASVAEERKHVPELRMRVVDNASGDAPAITEALKDSRYDGWAELVEAPKNGGFAYGNNLSVRKVLDASAQPRYVFLLNPDARLSPGALKVLVNFMDEHPDAGIAGSGLVNEDESDWKIAFRFPSVWSELEGGLKLGLATRLLKKHVVAQRMSEKQQRVDWVAGASMLIRREVFETVGLMDEQYFLYYEETDFCLAALRSGWTCWYVPESRVLHVAGQSTGVTKRNVKQNRLPPYWFESRRRFFLKNYGWRYAAAADTAAILGISLFQVRAAIQRKENPNAPHLLSDLVKNSVLWPSNREVSPPLNK